MFSFLSQGYCEWACANDLILCVCIGDVLIWGNQFYLLPHCSICSSFLEIFWLNWGISNVWCYTICKQRHFAFSFPIYIPLIPSSIPVAPATGWAFASFQSSVELFQALLDLEWCRRWVFHKESLLFRGKFRLISHSLELLAWRMLNFVKGFLCI